MAVIFLVTSIARLWLTRKIHLDSQERRFVPFCLPVIFTVNRLNLQMHVYYVSPLPTWWYSLAMSAIYSTYWKTEIFLISKSDLSAAATAVIDGGFRDRFGEWEFLLWSGSLRIAPWTKTTPLSVLEWESWQVLACQPSYMVSMQNRCS